MNRDLSEATQPDHISDSMRGPVRLVAFLNIAYFGIEFAVALAIGSVSLFADSIDFLEGTALNLLILIGLEWSARNRARLGMVLSGLLLVPGVAKLWTVWRKFTAPVPPGPLSLSLADSDPGRSGVSRMLFTSAFKELGPIPQFKATAKLGEFLEARFSHAV